ALLIVDMQNEFINPEMGDALNYKADNDWERWKPFYDRIESTVTPNNIKLLEYFRNNNMPATFGRIACLLPNGEDRAAVQKTEGWNGIYVYANSKEAEMVEGLEPHEGEIVVNKTTDSVSAGTNYSLLLRNMGIETVVVTGVVTDQCVAGSIRSLADDGFKVICVEDACGAPDLALHDAELKIMNMIYCNVLSTKETIQVLEGKLK
ncbi:MAG: isochorismatase family cysteine hydrolase, partial [Erysipelotrichales bacterium]